MVRWALQNLRQERWRVLATAGGVAAALLVILLLQGAFAGVTNQIVGYVEHTDADVWVMQEGVSNMHMATSVLPADTAGAIRAASGADPTPILYTSTFVTKESDQWLSYIVGIKPDAERGGPWAMAKGQSIPAPGEAVIPEVMAEKGGIRLGDAVTILDRSFAVVGLSKGTFSMANPVTFVSYDDLGSVLGLANVASYFLIKTPTGSSPAALADQVQSRIPNVHVMTRDALAASDRDLSGQMGADLIRIMAIIGLVIGTLVIGFGVYTSTVHRAREYGIVRALGGRMGSIVRAVLVQTVTITAASLALAVALAYAAKPLVSSLAPEVALAYPMSSLGLVAGIALIIAALASVLPAIRISGIDPALVFRE